MSDLLTPDLSRVAPMGVHLAVALLCGFLLSLLYRRTYRGASYSVTFDRSLILLAVITAIVIMVIGNNVARAFGLVGAMSIIRFRTALKDAQDLVFVFASLAVGLAAGVGLHALAVLGTLVVAAVILVLAATNYGALGVREFVLQLSYEPGAQPDGAPSYLPAIDQYARRHRLLGARTSGEGEVVDLTYYVTLREAAAVGALTRAVAATPGVSRVNIFYDEEPA